MVSVEQIRGKMRISHAHVDGDIADNIDAAWLDMSRVGIDIQKDDALLDKAVELFCKAQFDYLGKGEQFQKNYESLRDAMSLSGGYRCGTK